MLRVEQTNTMKKLLKSSMLCIFSFTLFLSTVSWAQLGDVTNSLTYLGSPTTGQYPDNTELVYARNVWTLKAWAGGPYAPRIYMGSGNANNAAPAINAGPVYIRTFTPSTGLFGVENAGVAIEEEEIQTLQDIGGNLFIPGIDPTSGVTGAYYSLSPGSGWSTHTNIPNQYHVYDLIQSIPGGDLIAAGAGVYDGQYHSGLQRTTDGTTWVSMTCSDDGCLYYRFYRLFWLAGKLYASSRLGLYEYQAPTHWVKLSAAIDTAMLPGFSINYRVSSQLAWAGGLAYLVSPTLDDHHTEPKYLMFSSVMGAATNVPLPSSALKPRGLLVIGSTLYLLQNGNTGDFWSVVYKTTDLVNWSPVLYFKTLPGSGFARSFEYYNGYFYFGMGTYAGQLSNVSGQLARIAFTP